MSNTDFELFPGKDMSSLFKDIYNNQQTRKKSISQLIAEIRKMIRHIGDWAIIGPVIKDLVDTSVRNDESLLKMATIAQRMMNASVANEGEDGFLTDKEKEQLLSEVESVMNEVADETADKVDELEFAVEGLKEKIKSDESKSKNKSTIK